MRVIRYCAPFVTALSFFVAAPSSADVIYQFSGVCVTYWNDGITPEPVSCSTLADPSFQLTLSMDPGYESAGYTDCSYGNPNPCLLKQLFWIDHADASGAAFTAGTFRFGEFCEATVSNVPPVVDVAVFGECGFSLFIPNLFGGGPNSVQFAGFGVSGLTHHLVEGFGVWSRIDEPTPLALAGLALFLLAFARRRNAA
jgi:hypothetical protein